MKNIKLKSDCDGLMLDVLINEPKGDIKGIVQISHGMAEHKERYISFMEFLANLGFASVIHDHRGHGQSVKTQRDLGYFYDEKGEYVVEDLHQITTYIKNKYPGKKVILLGHSMGSMIARKYIKKYDSDIDKLIICGSPSKNSFVNLAIFFVKMMKKFEGERYRCKFCQEIVLGKKNKNNWICTDEDIVRRFNSDERCGFVFTLNGFLNLLYLMKDIYSPKGWRVKNSELPILFIAGKEDKIIINEKKWIKSQEFLKKLGYEKIDKILYSDMKHEVLNEINKDVVWRDIYNWIQKGV